jgi:transcriptional regulator of nitric oxide reductase
LKSGTQTTGKHWFFRAPALALVSLVLLTASAGGSIFHTQDAAFALAFPEATRIEDQTFILTGKQVEELERMSRAKLPRKVLTIHSAWKGDTLLGYAHIDVHTVRTKPEALLVVLDPKAHVTDTRVLAFHEPLEFMPSGSWYQTFVGQGLDSDLRVGFDVDGVTGATLTTWATVDSVRRMLAFYQVLLQSE